MPVDQAVDTKVKELCQVRLDLWDERQRYKALSKLHKQFVHPGSHQGSILDHIYRLDLWDERQRYKALSKLHKQFVHPSKKRFVSLMKDARCMETRV